MAKAARLMRERLARTQLLLEVRDARVPVSAANRLFDQLGTPRLVVLNKADLAPPGQLAALSRQLGCPAVCASVKRRAGLRQLLQAAHRLIQARPRFKAELPEVRVVGLPNSGKSSLINALRAGSPAGGKAVVSGRPGTTRAAVGFRLAAKRGQGAVLIDTPGVLAPKIEDSLVGLRLALVGAVREAAVPPELLADYLLFQLNKQPGAQYTAELGLGRASDDIQLVLAAVSKRYGIASEPAAAKHFVGLFRQGKLGKFLLDDPLVAGDRPDT